MLDDKPNKIPIYKNLQEALDGKGGSIAAFIYGMAPLSGAFSSIDRDVMFYAMERNLDIVNGLHDFLTDDASFVQKAAECSVQLHDIRKQQDIKQRTTLGDHPSLSLPARAKHQASPQNLRSVSKNAT
ncbi:DUF1611 domain-containing protein [Desulfovibrio ferrophilus]|uniref:GFO/IDH/MOCA family oxidoreductase fused to GTPase/ATPase domain n=1 Tax=Desulfovibrio ferrophilus TaxID=241368 RepID=A0A2Z6AVJ6_9BACT|nr:DUF1611 domain-containing protein [Desulfovibrio ferrophilus]BBD07206.1 GFO/IDH/MOCA family oxidoreductase fused to GTPase/ATPase domain [Desulfovibrio ferrophilus]